MILKGFKFGMLLQFAVGPICLFIFQTATTANFFIAELGVLAVTLIDAIYILAAIYGIGSILNRRNKAKALLKYFGAFVLIIFGLSNILGSFDISFLPSLNFSSTESVQNIFIKTLFLTLSNPLTILFWAGVFSTKIIEEDLDKYDMYYFGFGAVLSTIIFLTFIALLGSTINTVLNPSAMNILNIIVGIVLIFFSVKVLYKKN